MKKQILAIILVIVTIIGIIPLSSMSVCANSEIPEFNVNDAEIYIDSAEDFIGKTAAEIEAEFGAFDCCGMPVSEDGLYRNTACGYTIKNAKVSFFGTNPEVLFFITFNESGIAVACNEGHRPGG